MNKLDHKYVSMITFHFDKEELQDFGLESERIEYILSKVKEDPYVEVFSKHIVDHRIETVDDYGINCTVYIKDSLGVLINEYSEHYGRELIDIKGVIWRFFGIIDAEDDLYYGLWNADDGLVMISCVGDLIKEGYLEWYNGE